MLKYTLCLIKQGNNILLLNREYPAWMGCWNGIGGKIEKNESPRHSMQREIMEETQLEAYSLSFKGLITWSDVDRTYFGGLYLYLAELPEDVVYETPIKTDEGILDWKDIQWILHPDNSGVASNLSSCLEKVLQDDQCYNHHSVFSKSSIIEQYSTWIDPSIEVDEARRETYLEKYRNELAYG